MTDNSSQGRSQGVTDDLEQPTASAGTDLRSFELEYPEPPLHLSLESLLAHSSSTSGSASPTTNTMPPSEADHGSLDGSWASLIGEESSSEDDLQSEHTDVGSLLDVHSSDDVRSIADGVNTDDGDSTDDEGLGDTMTKSTTCKELNIPDAGKISEEEERGDDLTRNTASTQITEQETQRPFPLQYSSVKYTIQMPLPGEAIDLNTTNYFKVLLLGRQVEQFRTEIQRKLGDVLVLQGATSSEPHPTSVARFHLVPNTFGPGAAPEYADLVAIDKQIDFDCYDLVTAPKATDSGSCLVLRNRQTETEITSKWNGSRFVVENARWVVPDLAIICVQLGEDHIMDRDSYSMLSFVERHSIPRVVIRMDRGWSGRYDGAVSTNSLHQIANACDNGSERTMSSLLPVDMAAFLNLDATQLNNHLTYLISNAEESPPVDIENPLPISKEKPAPIFVPNYDHLPLPKVALLKSLCLVLSVVGIYSFLGYYLFWPIWSDTTLSASSGDVAASMSAAQPIQVTTTQPLLQASCITVNASGKSNQATFKVGDVTSVMVTSAITDDSRQFQVGVAGDHQLLVKLPKVALDHKQRSHLVVELRRRNQPVPATVHQLLDGVFSVQLLPHDAYGDIEVDLIMTRPRLHKTLTVYFGERQRSMPRYMRELGITMHEHVRGTMSNVSNSVQNTMGRLVFGRSWDLLPLEAKLLNLRRSCGQRRSELIRFREVMMDAIQNKIRGDVQTVQDNIVHYKEEFVQASKMLARALSSSVLDARLRLDELVRSTEPMRIQSKVHTAAVDKLETARGRAHRIVSNAAKNLRAPVQEA